MNIKEQVRLFHPDTPADAIIDFFTNSAQYDILNYCNINTMPPRLEFVWARMVLAMVGEYVNQLAVREAVEQGELASKTITEEGRSVSVTYRAAKDMVLPPSMMEKIAKDTFVTFKEQLNRFAELA